MRNNLWREYEWAESRVGRTKGKREGMETSAPLTATWVRRGWIRPVATRSPAPEPLTTEPTIVESFDGPPVHRAMRNPPRSRASKGGNE